MVYLIGAGPGDPRLITVKGLECLRKADVIVYDRLVNTRLLDYAKLDAEIIYAGKLPEEHTMEQRDINQLLINKASKGKTVIRLKGGDPFLFGRGGEEAEALAESGIPFEVVPGITSAIAVPAYAGIPVTHRQYTSTLAIITGNEDPEKEYSGGSAVAWNKIATGAGTLVFLMGMANLQGIIRRLVENGKPVETPVAVIYRGAGPEQETLVGTLNDITQKVEKAGFKNPAVIVVGEVVKMRRKLNWFEKKPLFGKKVLVTRAREQASALSKAIEELGGEPWEFPTIKVVEPLDFSPLDNAIKKLDSYHWLIFTSVNGVKSFFLRLYKMDRDIRDLKGINLCAIGPKTREALEERGLKVDFMPEEYRAEKIAAGLKGKALPGQHILLPRAEKARPLLLKALQQMGAIVNEVTAYRIIAGGMNPDIVREMLKSYNIQVSTFTSSSTVLNLAEMLGKDLSQLLAKTVVACIGPITAETAERLGVRVDIVAEEYTISGLIKAILAYFGKEA